jgi:ElaB/YqjD/DUF883 family membrane-anchored ribosome-binding protein
MTPRSKGDGDPDKNETISARRGDVAMNEMNKDDASRLPGTSGPQGSGSDTLSAANISAGTSVGNAGQPAAPVYQSGSTGASGQGSGGQSSGSQGTGSQNWAQGSTGAPPHTGGGSAYSSTSGGNQGSGDLRGRAGQIMNETSDWARSQYGQGARQLDLARSGLERFARENPLMIGVMGVAAGLVIGALLPRTRHEDRAFGRWADEVRQQGMRYAREATQRGREYVEEALGGDSEDEWRPGEDEGRGRVRSSGPRYQNH